MGKMSFQISFLLFKSPSRHFSLNMDPTTSLKRKYVAPAAHKNSKRLLTVQEGDGTLQCERPHRSPRISVLLDRLQQPITMNELTELLHYAALGKAGGVKQPR